MPEYIDESDDDPVGFDEKTERSWRVYLRHFKEEVYPVFQEHGFTLGEALMNWEINRMKNALNRLVDILEEK